MSEMRSPELRAAYEHCRRVAKREAKNFYYSFVALPKHKSDAMCAVYAFMRKADDLADDESISLAARREAMAAWTEDWRASRASAASDPVFIALNDTQQRFDIPDELLEQLVSGTTLDLNPQPQGVAVVELKSNGEPHEVQIYENFAALHQYCYLVASVVGLVCIRIFGYTDRRAEQYAVDTGIAFQLTNILRDIKEDAERGRIYLSADLLAQNNVEPQRILDLGNGAELQANEHALLQGLEQHAYTLYRSADSLIPYLSPDSRGAMRVLVRIYRKLLDKVSSDPAAVFRDRVSVSTPRKLGILFSGLIESFFARMFH